MHQKTIALGILLVAVSLLLYVPVVRHEFLDYDDSAYVTKNINVRTGLSLDNVAWAFTTFHEANWHPLTWLSHMADCQLFGLNSGFHHLVNVVLHAINVLLVFLLLQRATGAVWCSFFVAALFAVHPLNVETVAWVAERKSLLSMLFCLATLGAYGWYAKRPSWKRYLIVVVAFSLALMSKPMAVSLPFVLLLVDHWPLERDKEFRIPQRWLQLSIEKLPLLLMSAASCLVTMIAQRSGGAVENLPLSLRMGNALVSYVKYIAKTIWPSKLSVFYPHPESPLPWYDVIAAAVILTVISALVFYFHRARYLTMGWCLFVVTLTPVIGIVQVGRQAMADRYAYIPCIGLFIIMAWSLSRLGDAIAIAPVVRTVAALGLILALMVATDHYLAYWRNGVELLTRAALVAGRPDPGIEEALADALLSAGRVGEAYYHYGKVCTLRPGYAVCHYNMAEILFHRHQLQDALQQYQLAASFTDSRDTAVSSLIRSAEILLDLGDYKTAETRLTGVLQIDPNNNTALQLRQRLSNEKSGENR